MYSFSRQNGNDSILWHITKCAVLKFRRFFCETVKAQHFLFGGIALLYLTFRLTFFFFGLM